MRRVHREATERMGANRLGRNGMRHRVHQEAWMEQAMETRPGVPQNGGNGPRTVETGVLLIGRGVAYRKTEETDLLRSKWGHVHREGPGVPQNGGNGPPTVETGVLLIGRGVAYLKTDETDLLRGNC